MTMIKRGILAVLLFAPVFCMGQTNEPDTIEILELKPLRIKSIKEQQAEASVRADSVYSFLQGIDLGVFSRNRNIAIQETPLDLEVMKANGLDLLAQEKSLCLMMGESNMQEIMKCVEGNNYKYIRPIYNWHISRIEGCLFGVADSTSLNEIFADVDFEEFKKRQDYLYKKKKKDKEIYLKGAKRGFESMKDNLNLVFVAMGVPAFNDLYEYAVLPVYTNLSPDLRFLFYSRNGGEQWRYRGGFMKDRGFELAE